MITEEYTTIIIKAEEGKYLTNRGTKIDIKDRIIAETIALGKYDSADNYKEISSTKAEEYRQLKEEAIKAEAETEENKSSDQ